MVPTYELLTWPLQVSGALRTSLQNKTEVPDFYKSTDEGQGESNWDTAPALF